MKPYLDGFAVGVVLTAWLANASSEEVGIIRLPAAIWILVSLMWSSVSLLRNSVKGFMRAKRNRKSMIRRDMGVTYESATRIAARKSVWMVLYLRARRTGDKLKAFYRRKALEEAE
jgi:hypothetical protein